MIVENIGDVLVRGHKGFGPKVAGRVSILLSPEGCNPEQLKGRLVVIPHCDNTFLTVLKHASGVILQNYIGDSASETYAALVAKTFKIPVMTRADGAIASLTEGEEVTLDPQRGLIYRGSEENTSCPTFSFDAL
jgi:pyruvate kinase